VPIGALMLISDTPLKEKGVKTTASAKLVFEKYTGIHLDIGISVLKKMQAKEPSGLGYRF
jgi:AMP nucleosidase